jgi:hypothetical protein
MCKAHDICFDTCDNTGGGFNACNLAFQKALSTSCSNQKQNVYKKCQNNICRGGTKAEREKCLALLASVKECDDEWAAFKKECDENVKLAYGIVNRPASCQAYKSAQESHCKCKVK